MSSRPDTTGSIKAHPRARIAFSLFLGSIVCILLFTNWSGFLLARKCLHPFYRHVLESRAQRLFRQFQQSCTHFNVEYSRVLDFGCGFGGLSELLKRNKTPVVSVDVADHFIYREHDLRIISKDVEQLPFPTGAFDLAVSSYCFHHIPAHKHLALIAELLRVARRVILIEEDPSRNLLCRFLNSEMLTHANAHNTAEGWKECIAPHAQIDAMDIDKDEFSLYIRPLEGGHR